MSLQLQAYQSDLARLKRKFRQSCLDFKAFPVRVIANLTPILKQIEALAEEALSISPILANDFMEIAIDFINELRLSLSLNAYFHKAAEFEPLSELLLKGTERRITDYMGFHDTQSAMLPMRHAG